MAKYRLVVTTNSNNVVYGSFSEAGPAELKQLEELCEMLGKLNYLNIGTEDGNKQYFRGDAIESIKIERSAI